MPRTLFAVFVCSIGIRCGSDEPSGPAQPSSASVHKAELKVGFALQSGDDWTIEIDGCASGLRASVTQAQSHVDLLIADTDCIGKLRSFILDGALFSPAPGEDFPNYEPGATAVFEDADHRTITAMVRTQLPSPITSDARVEYQLDGSGPSGGSTASALGFALGGTGRTAPPLTNPPDFRVASIEIVATVPRQQAFQVVARLECKTRLTHTSRPELARCGDQKISDLRYALMADDYDGRLCGPLTLSLCRLAMRRSTVRTVDVARDLILPDTPGMMNGGFKTRACPACALTTPSDVARRPEMLIVVEGPLGFGFDWLEVDLRTRYTQHPSVMPSR